MPALVRPSSAPRFPFPWEGSQGNVGVNEATSLNGCSLFPPWSQQKAAAASAAGAGAKGCSGGWSSQGAGISSEGAGTFRGSELPRKHSSWGKSTGFHKRMGSCLLSPSHGTKDSHPEATHQALLLLRLGFSLSGGEIKLLR